MLGTSATKIRSYAVLPLRDIVVFPHMIVPLFVGREKSVVALENVIHADKKILLVTQKNPSEDDPQSKDLYTIGTVGTILQLLKLPDGTVKVLVEGGQRVHINSFSEDRNFLEATVTEIPDTSPQSPELEALSRSVMNQFTQNVKLNKKIPPDVIV